MSHPDPNNLSAVRVDTNRALIYPRVVGYEDADGRLGLIDEDLRVERRDQSVAVVWSHGGREDWVAIGPADKDASVAIKKMMDDYEDEKAEGAVATRLREFGHRLRWSSDLGPIRLKLYGSRGVERVLSRDGVPGVRIPGIVRPNLLGIRFGQKWKRLLLSGMLTVDGPLLTISPPKSLDGRTIDLDPDVASSDVVLHRNRDLSDPADWDAVRDAATSVQRLEQAGVESVHTSSSYASVARTLLVFDTSGYAEWASAELQMDETNYTVTSGGQVARAYYDVGGLTLGGDAEDSGHYDEMLSVQTGTTVTHSGDDWTISNLQDEPTWGDTDFHIALVHGEDNGADDGLVGDYHGVAPTLGDRSEVFWDDETIVIEVTGSPSGGSLMMTGIGT